MDVYPKNNSTNKCSFYCNREAAVFDCRKDRRHSESTLEAPPATGNSLEDLMVVSGVPRVVERPKWQQRACICSSGIEDHPEMISDEFVRVERCHSSRLGAAWTRALFISTSMGDREGPGCMMPYRGGSASNGMFHFVLRSGGHAFQYGMQDGVKIRHMSRGVWQVSRAVAVTVWQWHNPGRGLLFDESDEYYMSGVRNGFFN
ncbi:hypothetical protein EDC04DRAFT_2607633 [Pisolithus marmoratus]|nr:hypothetical protein EDC04DRAFT_2607633 [Pisolithus marmoratus]